MIEGKNVDIVLNDVYQWNEFQANSFDVVIAGQVFEHVEYPWITMLEITRVMKNGGICCIIAPSAGVEHRYPVDCWRYYPDGFRALAKYAFLESLEVFTEWGLGNYADGSGRWHDTVLVGRKPSFSSADEKLFDLKREMTRLTLNINV